MKQTGIFIAALAFVCLSGQGQEPPTALSLTPAEVAQAFAMIPTKPPTNKNIVEQAHYQVGVARVAGRNGPVELHQASDRIFFVKAGRAVLRVGGRLVNAQEIAPGELRGAAGKNYSGYREVTMEADAILSVPRGVPYQLIAEKGDVSFIVVRIK